MNQRPKFKIPPRIDEYLQLLAEIYKASNNIELQSLIINAKPILDEGYEYDNWNGGTYGHLLTLEIPLKLFIRVESRLGEISNNILQRLNNFITIENESICGVSIILSPTTIQPSTDWRAESGLLLQQPKTVISTQKQNRLWKRGAYRIFLSHKTEDKIQTAKLKHDLSIYGIDCFVAHEDIEPTQEWAREIESALFSADACVALMTERYHESYWTDHEIGCAYGLQIPVIAVRLGCDPYGIIGRFQAIRSTWRDLKMDLMKVLLKQDKVKLSLIPAILASSSFATSNSIAELFPLIDSFPENNIDDLIEAWAKSYEAHASFGFDGSRANLYGPGLAHYITKWASNRYPTQVEVMKTFARFNRQTLPEEDNSDVPF